MARLYIKHTLIGCIIFMCTCLMKHLSSDWWLCENFHVWPSKLTQFMSRLASFRSHYFKTLLQYLIIHHCYYWRWCEETSSTINFTHLPFILLYFFHCLSHTCAHVYMHQVHHSQVPTVVCLICSNENPLVVVTFCHQNLQTECQTNKVFIITIQILEK